MIDHQNKEPITSSEHRKKEKQKVINWLIETFPSAFFKKAREVKPLKIGILDDILDHYHRLEIPPFSKRLLREGLHYYTGSTVYLRQQKANSPRIDLFGNEVDLVSDEQARYATETLASRKEKTAYL